MKKIKRWFKVNRIKIENFDISIFLALAVIFIGKIMTKNAYIYLRLFGWFGFNSIENQIMFCSYPTILVSISISLVVGFLMDRFIIKRKFNSFARKVFWISLLVMILFTALGHYRNIKAISPYNLFSYEEFKWAICY
ncbi:MAG: hypothetical protein KAK00_10625 [Nanoarchaeota archaeon]|nr:hypothetical protein [Nanoarchaeota archaeon]